MVGLRRPCSASLAGVGFAKLLGALFKAVGFGLPLAGITVHAARRVSAARGRRRRHAGRVVCARAAGDPCAADRGAARGRRAAARPGSPASPRTSRASARWPDPAVFLASPDRGRRRSACSPSPAARSLSFIGLAMVSRYLIRPLARAIGWPLERCVGGASGRLARENTTRNTGRTAVTAAALMIGIGLVVFFSVLINGFKQSSSARSTRASPRTYVQSHSQGVRRCPRRAVTAAQTDPASTAIGIAFTRSHRPGGTRRGERHRSADAAAPLTSSGRSSGTDALLGP